jgi:hypothetical protein
MGEPAGCPGAPVGGHQARNTDRRARGNSARPSGQGPQRSGLWTGSYPKVRRRHEQPAFNSPTRTPVRPHERQPPQRQQPAATRTAPNFHARATIPRMCWLVGNLVGNLWGLSSQRERSAVAGRAAESIRRTPAVGPRQTCTPVGRGRFGARSALPSAPTGFQQRPEVVAARRWWLLVTRNGLVPRELTSEGRSAGRRRRAAARRRTARSLPGIGHLAVSPSDAARGSHQRGRSRRTSPRYR